MDSRNKGQGGPGHPDVIVVAGYLGRCPLAGYGWQVLNYLVGLRDLGFDPYFYEDTAYYSDCFDPVTGTMYSSPDRGVEIMREILDRFGFHDRWVFWDAQRGIHHGLDAAATTELLWSARIVLTLAPVTRLPRRQRERKIFIDLDPGYTQLKLEQGDRALRSLLAEQDFHFTIGENIGSPRCPIPSAGFNWRTTRQPIVNRLWAPLPVNPNAPFTTIGRWDESRRDVIFEGVNYGWNKRQQWLPFLDLPRQTGARFVLGVDADKTPEDRRVLESHGWGVVDPLHLSREIQVYRQFIRQSFGEFTVAKDLNVRLNTGWFSDRAACYLSAGRPVINQATGFENVLPTGEGLFAFRTATEAAEAIRFVRENPETHSRAARRIAEEHFDAMQVLRRVIDPA